MATHSHHSAASARAPWRPGSRIHRLRASHSYRIVLVSTAALFLVMAAAPDDSWSRTVFVALELATLVTAVWTTGLARDARPTLSLAIAIAIAVAIAQVVFDSDAAGPGWISGAVLLTATVIVLGVGVVDQGGVNAQSILGAICIYVLLGLIYADVFGAVASLGSGPFFAQGTDGTPSIRVYFSYVTLATLGYGDYTPAGDLGRTLVVGEALLGQLYLVTVVALLVSRLARRPAPGEAAPGTEPGASHD
jgi:ion channel